MTRDFSPLYHERSIRSTGACRLCGRVPADREAHAQLHLETAEAVVQYDYRKSPAVERVVPTDSVPTTDADGFSIWESDGDRYDRQDANAQHLRDAHSKARELNRALARKLRAAQRKASA